MEQQPSVGRIVHFVEDGGECRAALVTAVERVDGEPTGRVTLTVFRPREETHKPLIEYLDPGVDGTWHWPERV